MELRLDLKAGELRKEDERKHLTLPDFVCKQCNTWTHPRESEGHGQLSAISSAWEDAKLDQKGSDVQHDPPTPHPRPPGLETRVGIGSLLQGRKSSNYDEQRR